MRLFDYIHQGGAIMYILLAANIVGISLLLWRMFVIWDAKKNLAGLADNVASEFKSSIGSLGQSSAAIGILKDQVQVKVHGLEFGLNTIKIIASVAPLMGLLGTVIGILTAFQVISEKGMSDPTLFAGGIAMALVTTVGGLIVAIPHFVGYNYLVGLLDDLEIQLEKKSIEKIYGSTDGAKV